MTLRQVPLADCAREPWRNGGGETRELLRWPAALPSDGVPVPLPGIGADDWLIRVSVAEIARDGPFSAYPGIERWFAVLHGSGVRLGLPEGEQTLRPGDEALHFAGEAGPTCTLLEGSTQDLNLMHRRGPVGSPIVGPTGGPRALMRRARPGSVLRGRLPWRALYAHAPTTLITDEESHDLPAGTLAWSDAHTTEIWEVAGTPAAFWMSLAT